MSGSVVGVCFLAVPDGTAENGNVRLSVQVTPGPVEDAIATVALESWPSAVHGLARNLRILAGRLTGGQPTALRCIEAVGSDTATLMAGPLAQDADALWRQIFDGTLGALLEAVTPDAASSMAVATGKERQFLETYASQVDGHIEEAYQWMMDRAIQKDVNGLKSAYWKGQTWREALDWVLAPPADARPLAVARANALAEGKQLVTPTKAMAPDAIRLQAMSGFAAYLGEDELPEGYDPQGKPPEDPEDTIVDKARMALAQVLAIPTLAKYLGLIVDFEIPVADWHAAIGHADGVEWTGPLAVEPSTVTGPQAPRDFPLSSTQVRRRQWTMGRYVNRYFGPCEKEQAKRSATHDKGLLLLRCLTRGGGARRYSLGTIDIANTFLSLRKRAMDVEACLLSGRMTTDETVKVPAARGRGIVLYDADAAPAAESAEVEYQKALDPANGLQLNYAEDLTRGIRVDVAVARGGAVGAAAHDAARWRTLTARDVTCARLPEDFIRDPAVSRVRYRDDGYVGIGAVGETETQHAIRTSPMQELFAWQGESLAVQSRLEEDDEHPTPEPLPAIQFSQSLPKHDGTGPDRRIAPLRDGKGYFFGARVAYVNGCGLDFAEGVALHAADASGHVLGSPGSAAGDDPYVFARQERISPPKVCLPWDSALISASETDLTLKWRGSKVDCIVVKPGDKPRAANQRFLLPPEVSFDIAEQQGQFDAECGVPLGAFQGALKVRLGPERGALPIARAGNVIDLEHSDEKDNGASRGHVVELNARAPKPGRPYHVDRYAKRVRATIVGGNAPLKEYALNEVSVNFWANAPKEAWPILIEAVARPDAGARAKLSTARDGRIPRNASSSVNLGLIRVQIAPAESVDVRLESASDPNYFLASHAAGHRILRALKRNVDVAADRMGVAVRRLSEEDISSFYAGRTIVRVVYPVPRPLGAPSLTALHPVVLSMRPDSMSKPIDAPRCGDLAETWREYVQTHIRCDTWGKWTSAIGGATTYFVGSIKVHRDSTGAMRCDARWQEHGPEAMTRDPETGHWVYLPPMQHAALFNIANLPPRSVEDTDTVDLVFNGDEPRALAHAFPDGRARRLKPRVIATSRFTEFYPKLEGGERPSDEIGPHDIASSSFDEAPDIWVPCTFRPPPPVVDRAIPMLIRQRGKVGRKITVTRRSKLRVYLGTADWFASGEDERLAVIFHPVNTVCDFKGAELAPFANVLTQWGVDPLHPTATPAIPLTVKHLFNGEQVEGTLRLPVPVAPNDRQEDVATLDVTAMAFRPQLDPELGLYCDIGIEVDARYAVFWPFVRLGLARYQAHAVDGLELSTPIGLDVRWMQDRDVEVVLKSGRQVELTVLGPVPQPDTTTGHFGAPVLDVRLMRRNGAFGSFRWTEVLNEDDAPIRRVDVEPNLESTVRWHCLIDLPHHYKIANYALQIEESIVIHGADGDEVGRVGPTFATLIELR